MSYDFGVAAAAAPGWRALRDAIALDDLRVLPGDDAADGWPVGACPLPGEPFDAHDGGRLE